MRQMGLAAWIDAQLAPQRIDDAALQRRLPAMPERPAAFATQQESRRFGRESVQALAAAKLIRAVHSERQLEEVLVDFWFNHFNVFAGKGRTGALHPRVRARGDSPARARPLPRHARRHGDEPGDALLSRQLAERRPRGR